MTNINNYVEAAQQIIVLLGLPRSQQNERSALCLLALINLTPDKSWSDAENPLIGITPIMNWARKHYGKEYAPNTRETIRRQTMHQFCDAGIAIYNPDKLDRPVNSPKAAYQIEPAKLFAGAKAGLVYVTAFPNRAIMGRYLGEIAWETEVWVANSPSHLIHFNGERFLGPYGSPK
jgi:hypothetical protein